MRATNLFKNLCSRVRMEEDDEQGKDAMRQARIGYPLRSTTGPKT